MKIHAFILTLALAPSLPTRSGSYSTFRGALRSALNIKDARKINEST